MSKSLLRLPADDENDAVLFEKIKKGEYDADDPIWDNVSVPAKDLVVCTHLYPDLTLSQPSATTGKR